MVNLSKGTQEDIPFSNYSMEFSRFYEDQKKRCDEIAGLKIRTVGRVDAPDRLLINRQNFIYGIKRLNSFIIDYLYLVEPQNIEKIHESFSDLERTYLNDSQYHTYIKKSKNNNLSISQDNDFNKKYLEYLKWTFDVFYEMNTYLINSLNVSARGVSKRVKFVDYDTFFQNLSRYRDEVSDDISNIEFENIFDHYKKIMAYYYTYKYLAPSVFQNSLENSLKYIFDFITEEESIKTIRKLKDPGEEVSVDKRKEINGVLSQIRDCFNLIYYFVNYSLSLKDVLPKSKISVLVDRMLI